MPQERKIESFWKSVPTLEGAGVSLKRAFGFRQVPDLDPFLLLDDFHSSNPLDYTAGFPKHPHRGIETVTYVLHGSIEHQDSLGNKGTIDSGCVQWMTAGSGIIHSEMPLEQPDYLQGFQLWINLPAAHKMAPPRYRDIRTDQIPLIELLDGVRIQIICGKMNGINGPVEDLAVPVEYLDVTMPAKSQFQHKIPDGHRAFAYVISGEGHFDSGMKQKFSPETLISFDKEGGLTAAADTDFRFLLCSGKPLNESVAWYGPIVMNTQAELDLAYYELRNGTFIKDGKAAG